MKTLNITDLQTVSVDLKKLSDIVDIDIVKKAVFERLYQNVFKLENEILALALLIILIKKKSSELLIEKHLILLGWLKRLIAT